MYHHLLPAWLTRTLRSNVFCLLLPAETTRLYANRQEAPPSSSSSSSDRRGGEPTTAVTVSDCDKCTPRVTTEGCCCAAATRADSTLFCHDRSLFTAGRDTFTNRSEIHFSHFPSKSNTRHLIMAPFTLARGGFCGALQRLLFWHCSDVR